MYIEKKNQGEESPFLELWAGWPAHYWADLPFTCWITKLSREFPQILYNVHEL